MDSSYVCSLDEKTLKKAKKELGEDPKQRLGAVETFREWILQQKHIKCDTDTVFLLRFLRSAKFSQLRARELLENYLKTFTKFPDWCQNIDTQKPGIKAFLKSGYLMKSVKDAEGRYVIVMGLGATDPATKDYTKEDMMQALVAMFFKFIYDENNMVNGNLYLIDCSNYTFKHQAYMGIDNMKKSTQLFQKSYPIRFKGFHYYNIGPVVEGVLKLLKPIMSKKWVDRIKTHRNLESVYKYLSKDCLPAEYLPDDYTGSNSGTIQECIDDLHDEMTSDKMRSRVLRLTNPENFHIDFTEQDTTVPQESFRKLNID